MSEEIKFKITKKPTRAIYTPGGFGRAKTLKPRDQWKRRVSYTAKRRLPFLQRKSGNDEYYKLDEEEVLGCVRAKTPDLPEVKQNNQLDDLTSEISEMELELEEGELVGDGMEEGGFIGHGMEEGEIPDIYTADAGCIGNGRTDPASPAVYGHAQVQFQTFYHPKNVTPYRGRWDINKDCQAHDMSQLTYSFESLRWGNGETAKKK